MNPRASRWRFTAWLVVLICLPGCDGSSSSDSAGDGFVSADYQRGRQEAYLDFATTQFVPGSIVNVIAHLERDRVDPAYDLPGAIPANAWDGVFTKLAALADTRDFDALYLVNVLLGYRDHPALPRELVERVEQALLAFKYWYTEPTQAGMIDNSYYWTENHQIIYHTIEYLIGETYPDRVFGSDGKSGDEHREHARPLILRWIDHRARFGFSEWHSNVYYQEDIMALLTLAELAADAEVATRATMAIDLLLYDIAVHTFRGAFGVTHGRSYKKDKMTSLHEDTWELVKQLFDTATYDFQSVGDASGVLFARARRYRLPDAIWRVAQSSEAFADRERMGLFLNELGPYEPNPAAPYEFSFTDPNDLGVWWGMGALTTWPIVPLTVQIMNQYDLWETELFRPFEGLRPFTVDITAAQQLAVVLARQLGFGLLNQVNSYTYRTADYLLSSALDYRKGSFAAQVHAWQATFDANALVFTTHAFRPPLRSIVWRDDTETGSYWTGEASMPRSAQHENVALHLYAPQYPAMSPAPLEFFRYEPYTHAYFPQDHFDEVVSAAPWTFGRLGDGYVALYSYRPTTWITYDPAEYATNGMVLPFDLRADGGADNVWIVECGRAADWGSFEAFQSAIGASAVNVTIRPLTDGGLAGGFDVRYESPSQGPVTFGWEAPFTVNGAEIAIGDFPRHDNPWTQTPFNTRRTEIEIDGAALQLDFEAGTRAVFAAPKKS